MFTEQQILERIEDALTQSPTCMQCGQPTAIAQREQALWLECASITRPRGRLESLLRFDFAALHTRRPVVELGIAA